MAKLLERKFPSKIDERIYVDCRNVIAKEFRNKGLYLAMIYYNYSYLRSKNVQKTIAFFPDDREIIAQTVFNAKPCSGVKPYLHTRPDGKSFNFVLHQMPNPNYICHIAWQKLTPEWQNFMVENVISNHLTAKVKSEIDRFYANEWFKAVKEGYLSKEQYIETLGNILSYVRWTTRILALVVSKCEDQGLRSHFLTHLNGEIDHDQYILSDIDHLNGNVEYIDYFMIARPDIAVFMSTQASLLSFYQRPEQFLAVPYTIEGFTAFLGQEFLEDLKNLVSSWGVAAPGKAIKFLASHIHTDGHEENGHWVMAQRMLVETIRDELSAARFHKTILNVSDSMNRGFESIVEVPCLVS